eukprot:6062488-Alexandrium_andersonii.AAC.1
MATIVPPDAPRRPPRKMATIVPPDALPRPPPRSGTASAGDGAPPARASSDSPRPLPRRRLGT